ncbi:MAG TPA: hypothetical protein VFL86_06035, partial [Burkholderiaceae bacterium]|nr:hypothetical protein [Burkholderiaceae bacterium]
MGTAAPLDTPLPHVHPPLSDAIAMALVEAERRLPQVYTVLADPAAQARHAHHQQAVAQALAELKARP